MSIKIFVQPYLHEDIHTWVIAAVALIGNCLRTLKEGTNVDVEDSTKGFLIRLYYHLIDKIQLLNSW